MRKRKQGRKFSRTAAPRRALLDSLIRALIIKGRIQTTEARAKETQRFAEKLITKTRTGSMAARRYAALHLDARATKKLLDEIAPRYKERKGGYTRVIKLGVRGSDGARMGLLEFVQ
ncbi:MAG: 50S ribosomal protein L17 [Parcubacteria group bacterium]|nr:50S ribosomal protein L17 [Parcubacteria group bacterium]MBI4217251.1 50S ribosomal protein L17 [Parcubacteria group bacterium]